MSFQKILVPTDGSEFTKAAIVKAVELAKLVGGQITALYVVDKTALAGIPADASLTNVYASLKKEGQAALDYVGRMCDNAGVPIDVKIREGSPVNEILAESEDGYDLIVMGTLGRTGMSKLLMGSVAEKVVRTSDCPVMVVKSSD